MHLVLQIPFILVWSIFRVCVVRFSVEVGGELVAYKAGGGGILDVVGLSKKFTN